MSTLTVLFPVLFSLVASPTATAGAGVAGAPGYRQVLIRRHGGPDVLQLVRTSPLPEPGPGEVRLRVLTASASFTDVMVRKGLYRGVAAELPYPPGYDLVGVVDKLGEGVSELEIG